MSYVVVWEPEAEDDLTRLAREDPIVASHVLDQVDRLAESPSALSRPSHFPYYPNRQMYRFRFDHDGRAYQVVLLFRYGQDEQTIHLTEISFQSFPFGRR